MTMIQIPPMLSHFRNEGVRNILIRLVQSVIKLFRSEFRSKLYRDIPLYRVVWKQSKTGHFFCFIKRKSPKILTISGLLVEISGIEPLTSWMPSAPECLSALFADGKKPFKRPKCDYFYNVLWSLRSGIFVGCWPVCWPDFIIHCYWFIYKLYSVFTSNYLPLSPSIRDYK